MLRLGVLFRRLLTTENEAASNSGGDRILLGVGFSALSLHPTQWRAPCSNEAGLCPSPSSSPHIHGLPDLASGFSSDSASNYYSLMHPMLQSQQIFQARLSFQLPIYPSQQTIPHSPLLPSLFSLTLQSPAQITTLPQSPWLPGVQMNPCFFLLT